MLADLWPHLLEDKALLQSETVWEGTRYCVDKDVTPELRQRIVHELACAYLEFGLRLGLKKIIGLMPTYIYRSVFERPGIEMDYLGPVETSGGTNAARWPFRSRRTSLRMCAARPGSPAAS